MSLVYIVTLNQLEGKRIMESLNTLEIGFDQLEFEFIRPSQLPEKLDPTVDLIVYNNHTALTMTMHQEILNWRKNGFVASILLLSRVPDATLFDHYAGLHNFVLLEKPFVEKDLLGITQKLLNTTHVSQRKFRRFTTDQQVAVSSYKTDFRCQPRVHNISLGGMCMQGEVSTLKVGDLLRINFTLDQLNVERIMNGRVIWVQPGKAPTAGIQFMNEDEVYGQLLRDIG